MAQFEGIEIPDDMLETISGGVFDNVSRDNLNAVVALSKQSGESLEPTMSALSYMETTKDPDEIKSLIIVPYPGE